MLFLIISLSVVFVGVSIIESHHLSIANAP